MECCLGRSKPPYNDPPVEKLCCICMSSEKTHLCVPCGHKCTCKKCTNYIKNACPICKQKIYIMIKVYE